MKKIIYIFSLLLSAQSAVVGQGKAQMSFASSISLRSFGSSNPILKEERIRLTVNSELKWLTNLSYSKLSLDEKQSQKIEAFLTRQWSTNKRIGAKLGIVTGEFDKHISASFSTEYRVGQTQGLRAQVSLYGRSQDSNALLSQVSYDTRVHQLDFSTSVTNQTNKSNGFGLGGSQSVTKVRENGDLIRLFIAGSIRENLSLTSTSGFQSSSQWTAGFWARKILPRQWEISITASTGGFSSSEAGFTPTRSLQVGISKTIRG